MGEDKKTSPPQPGAITGLEDTLDDTTPMPVLKFDDKGNPIGSEEPEVPGATLVIRSGTDAAVRNARDKTAPASPKSRSPFEAGDVVTVTSKPAEELPKAVNALKIAFAKENRESLFVKLGLNQPKQELAIPPLRAATYLMIASTTLNDHKNHQALADEIKIIAESREFPAILDDDGNLIIIAFSERGGVEKLFDIEESVRKAIPEAQMTLGSCNIKNHGDDIFSLTDEHLEKETFKKSPATPLTRISKALASKIADPDSRIGSNLDLSTAELDDPQFVRLIKAASIVSKEIGGPDELIGYDTEFANLYKYATDDETSIISLEGAGGMGKSRLRTELLKKLPAHILCSANSSDRTLPGASMVTFARQLTKIATENLDEESSRETLNMGTLYNDSRTEGVDESISMNEFQTLSHSKQVEFASMHPQTIAELCLEVMSKLREKQDPKTLFVFEDLHHVDHISEPHIIKLIQRYCQARDGQPAGKVLLTSRPEEMYQSVSFKGLKAVDSTKVIHLKGLNLWMDDRLGYKFAYHCLPPKLREGRHLGKWYRILAQKANKSPWAMKTFMDEVKTYDPATGSYPNLIITNDNVIELKPEALRRIKDIKDETDMANYFQERLGKLAEKPRKFLQYIALMDEDLHIGQIMAIFQKLLNVETQKIGQILSELGSSGYTSEDRLRGQFCKLQHESTKAIVLNSIPDQATKIAMAKELYELFKDEETFNPKTKHNLASIIAAGKPISIALDDRDEIDFWSDYEKLSKALFADAESNHNTDASYELSSTILNLPMVSTCLESLQTGKRNHTFIIAPLVIEALFNRAESARIMGKFDETNEALKALQNIHANFPENVDIIKLYLIAFNKAEMQNRQEEMKAIFQDIQKCEKPMPQSTRIRMEIVIAHYEERYDDVAGIYRENKTLLEEEARNYAKAHSSPSPIYLDLQRICEAKAPFEQIRKVGSKVGNQDFDDDVTMQPGAYTPEDLKKIAAIADRLDKIDQNMKLHSLGLNPWSAIKSMEQKATVQACLGQHETAIKLYSEVWRIADQLGLNNEAARAAKLKSDVQVIQALLVNNSTPEDRNEKIELLKIAIQTLNDEGIEKSLAKVSEGSDYQAILRFERMRATGIMVQELIEQSKSAGKDPAELAEELGPYITTALKDFQYVNQKYAAWAEAPFVQYYVMGYVGHILHAASQAGIKIEDENLYDSKAYPFMDLKLVESGLEFGNGMTDLDFGEVQRKLDGLYTLAKALRLLEHQKNRTRRTQRDIRLNAKKEPAITVPRVGTILRSINLGPSAEAFVDEIEEYDPEFVEDTEKIKSLALEIVSKAPDTLAELTPETQTGLTGKITEACQTFSSINKKWPKLAGNPEAIYHAASYLGFILKAAYTLRIDFDENIFDENSHPYIKLQEIKKAYAYAEKVTDLGAGNVETKVDSLSDLIVILESIKHHRRRRDRKEKDANIIRTRQKPAQQAA